MRVITDESIYHRRETLHLLAVVLNKTGKAATAESARVEVVSQHRSAELNAKRDPAIWQDENGRDGGGGQDVGPENGGRADGEDGASRLYDYRNPEALAEVWPAR